jgi:glyceraldehyde-3-phosphate dehydrogenase/erythrose-4-phosphate dehydrogenase
MAFRVPTIDVSAVDLVVNFEKGTNYNDIIWRLQEDNGIVAVIHFKLSPAIMLATNTPPYWMLGLELLPAPSFSS